MAAALLWAALEKARDPAPMAATIRSLGLPRKVAWPGTLFLTAAELMVAVAILFRPDSVLAQAGIVLLAALFALAGLAALRIDRPIPCSCFGAGGKGYLGLSQLVAFFPWLAGAELLRLGIPQAPPLPMGAAGFAAISLVIAAAQGIGVWKARLEARGDRRSAQEMYVWLPSR